MWSNQIKIENKMRDTATTDVIFVIFQLSSSCYIALKFIQNWVVLYGNRVDRVVCGAWEHQQKIETNYFIKYPIVIGIRWEGQNNTKLN